MSEFFPVIPETFDIIIQQERVVTVKAFTMDFIYDGLLTADTSEDLNKKLFERVSFPPKWGERPLLKLTPREPGFKGVLPRCYYSVWLSSTWAKDNQADGSELVVIWFDEIPSKISIEDIITKGIEEIYWEAHAEDFYY